MSLVHTLVDFVNSGSNRQPLLIQEELSHDSLLGKRNSTGISKDTFGRGVPPFSMTFVRLSLIADGSKQS
jgi:hypothetical protein